VTVRRPYRPLTPESLTAQTVKVMRTWLAELSPGPAGPLFPAQPGGRLSRDDVERLVAKHAATAADACPSVKDKHVTPHTLRHTAAMTLQGRGVASDATFRHERGDAVAGAAALPGVWRARGPGGGTRRRSGVTGSRLRWMTGCGVQIGWAG